MLSAHGVRIQVYQVHYLPRFAVDKYAWAGGKEFGVRIGWRKYLYECTPFGYVNLCIILAACGNNSVAEDIYNSNPRTESSVIDLM